MENKKCPTLKIENRAPVNIAQIISDYFSRQYASNNGMTRSKSAVIKPLLGRPLSILVYPLSSPKKSLFRAGEPFNVTRDPLIVL